MIYYLHDRGTSFPYVQTYYISELNFKSLLDQTVTMITHITLHVVIKRIPCFYVLQKKNETIGIQRKIMYAVILTSFFMVVDSFAEAQALFIRRIKDESSSFAFARLLIFSHASSTEGEFRISLNLAWAESNVSTISIVLS